MIRRERLIFEREYPEGHFLAADTRVTYVRLNRPDMARTIVQDMTAMGWTLTDRTAI